LTIFSTPKPFEGNAAVHQRNAITSWTLLRPRPHVIVLGDEPGASEICAELDLLHVPEVERNGQGTPLVSNLFTRAQRLARGEVICYVNSDIVLMSDFMEVLRQILAWRGSRPILAVGTRWNVWVREPIDFSSDWEKRLRRAVEGDGVAGGPGTIDYFVLSRGLYGPIPPFAVGRPYWDRWMVYAAWKIGASVIDITASVTAVHQRHDYGHYPGGINRLYAGEEGRRNRVLAGDAAINFGLRDATHVTTARGIQPAWRARGLRQWSLLRLRQRVHLLRASHPALNQSIGMGLRLYGRLRRTRAPIGWTSPAPGPSSSATPVRDSRKSSPGEKRTKAGQPSSDE
jgi:hypothetical protein